MRQPTERTTVRKAIQIHPVLLTVQEIESGSPGGERLYRELQRALTRSGGEFLGQPV
jgi:hypothetical protein